MRRWRLTAVGTCSHAEARMQAQTAAVHRVRKQQIWLAAYRMESSWLLIVFAVRRPGIVVPPLRRSGRVQRPSW